VIKRTFDVAVAAVAAAILSPLLLVVAALIKLDSPGGIMFRQRRIGRDFAPFDIYKFRTMSQNAASMGAAITCGDDQRITRVGRVLRKTKVDELPQLFNVLRGDMSLVGPRPELEEFVAQFEADYREILKVRPGITDMASLKYRDEAAILGRAADPIQEYVGHILPDKIRLAKEYVRRTSFAFDVEIIARTLLALTTRQPLA
jgi:lipopolysaccharide/colanic/teichoic acid biosynthesis glycosyltransferase